MQSDVDVVDESLNLGDIKDALDNRDSVMSVTCTADGDLASFAGTYHTERELLGHSLSFTEGHLLEQQGENYSHIHVMDGDSIQARLHTKLFSGAKRGFNALISGYNAVSQRVTGDTSSADTMDWPVDTTSPDYIIRTTELDPVYDDTDVRTMDPEQLYEDVPDTAMSPFGTTSCGSTYIVDDGSITPLQGEDAYVPAELRAFES